MLTASAFLSPRGLIDPALLFPTEDNAAVVARLGEYLANANATVAKFPASVTSEQRDDVVRAYVYYRAYDAVVDMMAARPSSFTASDEGSVTFSGAQLAAFAKKRDGFVDEYNRLVAEYGAVVVAPTRGQPTTSLRAEFFP